MRVGRLRIYRFPLALLLLALPLMVLADAGQVVFMYGKAELEAPDGTRQSLVQGQRLESGDKIVTLANGRVQIRMADGGLLALSPRSEFMIEDFNYPAAAGQTGEAAGEARSFFVLLKGGFRSITGAVGKENKQNYRVRTPVATIGIRGTDYTAMLCDGGCSNGEAGADGLYVGVTSGGVVLRNDGGSLDLDPGQFGYVKDASTAPGFSAEAAAVMGHTQADDSDEAEAGEESAEVSVVSRGEDAGGNPVDLTGGESETASGPVAFAGAPLGDAAAFSGVSAADRAALDSDTAGNLSGFTGDFPTGNGTADARYESGSAQIVNRGADEGTGIEWGRWSGGTADVTTSGGTERQDLSNSSLHWITGSADAPRPELPSTGTAQFSLVGNTNPTDDAGNVGTLGSASLAADFTDQTVDAKVNLSFDQTGQVWDASATDVDINQNATFDGQFDTVTVTTTGESGVAQGEGDLSGFFTADQNGELSGAGMGYSLTSGEDNVAGSAAFRVQDAPGP